MKQNGRLPLKILVILVISFLVGIAGIIMQNVNLVLITRKYRQITDELYERSLIMSDISSLFYHHEAIVDLHLMSDDSEMKELYGEQESLLRTQIRAKLERLGELLRGNTGEQLYHSVFSNAQSYFSNCDIVMYISSSGSSATADYYVQTIMPGFISDISSSLDELEHFTTDEKDTAKEEMERRMAFADICKIAGITSMVVSAAVSIYLCFRLTSALESYKDRLEADVSAKTHELTVRNRELTEFRNNTVIGLAVLIESRDGETGGHIRRTAAYVKMLAEAARADGYCADILTDEFISLAVRAAPMHDIGKIAIPDSILKKPGKLTPEEFDVMKTHAAEGERIVRDVLGNIAEKDFVDTAARVAGGHHEKWNGSGYPKGISGEDIPLEARIMALADVFDALVSKRCYKKSFPPDEAFRIIEESSGSHFDPELARIFLSMREDILKYLADNPPDE